MALVGECLQWISETTAILTISWGHTACALSMMPPSPTHGLPFTKQPVGCILRNLLHNVQGLKTVIRVVDTSVGAPNSHHAALFIYCPFVFITVPLQHIYTQFTRNVGTECCRGLVSLFSCCWLIIHLCQTVESPQLRRIRETHKFRSSSQYGITKHKSSRRRLAQGSSSNERGVSDCRRVPMFLNCYTGKVRPQVDCKTVSFTGSPLALSMSPSSIATPTASGPSTSLLVNSEASNLSVRRNRLKRSYAMLSTSSNITLTEC